MDKQENDDILKKGGYDSDGRRAHPTAFKEAQEFVMPYGQHKGMAIDDIACDDDGLRYLVWLRDQMRAEGKGDVDTHASPSDVYTALCIYLDDPGIAGEVEKL